MPEAAHDRILFGKDAGKTPAEVLLDAAALQTSDILGQAQIIKTEHDTAVASRDHAQGHAREITAQRRTKLRQLKEITGLASNIAKSHLRGEISDLTTRRYFAEQAADRFEQDRVHTLEAATQHLDANHDTYLDAAQAEAARATPPNTPIERNLPPVTHA